MDNKLYRGFIDSIDRANNLFGEIFKWSFVIMTISLTYGVFVRYVLNSPSRWVTDVCEQCCIFIGAFGGAYSYLSDGFVRVDILYDRLKLRGKALMDICTAPIIAVFAWMVTWQSFVAMQTSFANQETSVTIMKFPYYYGRTAVFIGAILLSLQCIAVLMKNIYVLVKNEPYPSGLKKEGK